MQIPAVVGSGLAKKDATASPSVINPEGLYLSAIQVMINALTMLQVATTSKMNMLN